MTRSASSGEGRRVVMVVDDDEAIREALADVLDYAGYQVVPVVDGKSALSRLCEGPIPDAIILDLWMPGMDGWTLRERLHAEPRWQPIPIVVVTAVRDRGIPTGPGVFALMKPVDLDELLALLARLLDHTDQGHPSASAIDTLSRQHVPRASDGKYPDTEQEGKPS